MKEQGVRFEKPTVKPSGIDAWESRAAVVETLFEMGKPTKAVKDSICGPNVPNEYDVDGVTIESFPMWSYMYVKSEKEGRKFIKLELSKKPEEVVAGVKKNILEMINTKA